MAHETLETELRDRVLTVTLSREDRLNAFNQQMLQEWLELLDEIDADDEVRAVVVTGKGRGFCAGADLGGGSGTFDAGAAGKVSRDGGGQLTLRLYDCRKPLIAAVNGPAVGVGVTLTLPMDIRLASDRARFGFVFARRGIVPEAASSWFLPRVVGINQAMEWVATGRVFPAAEALAGGLVSRVIPHEQLLDEAHALATEIAENTSGVSVCLARQMMWKMLGADHPMEAHKIDSRGMRELGQTADAREGVLSFLEKRPGTYPLRPSRDMPPVYPWWPEREFE